MKGTYSVLSAILFLGIYYAIWVLTLPFFVARLFLNAIAGDDEDVLNTEYKN
jgi:hypothetical protein